MSGAGANRCGVYGKVPSQADFLRSGAGEWAQAGLDAWFEEGVETLRRESSTLPSAPTSFLFAPPRPGAPSFVGAFAPSNDAVGRSFPLIVFAAVDPGDAFADRMARAPEAYAQFAEAAGALAGGAATLTGPDVAGYVQAMTAPDGALPGGDGAALESAPASALAASPKALAYALRTFGLACEQAAKIDPTARASVITVDAPAATPACRRFWLEMARRRLGTRIVPSLFWTGTPGEPGGRLLMTLGSPPPAVLGYLANPRHRATRFWPLRTDLGTALDQALAALTPDQKKRVETPGTTLAHLMAAFG